MGLALARMEAPGAAVAWRDTVEALRAQQARALLATEDLEASRGSEPRALAVEASSSVDVEALVRRCVRSWAASHGRWRVVLDWRAGRPIVSGEAGRLGQALDNLIANALEHGAGRVTVVGRRRRRCSVTVSVLDLGTGCATPSTISGRRRGVRAGATASRSCAARSRTTAGECSSCARARGTGVQICLPLRRSRRRPARPVPCCRLPGRPGVARSA